MFVLLFLFGVLAASYLSSLPNPVWLFAFLPSVFLLTTKYRIYSAPVLGFLWAIVFGHLALSTNLTSELENKKVLVTGVINSLPEIDDQKVRFMFELESIKLNNRTVEGPNRIRLSWYGGAPVVKAGDKWQLFIKLKKVNGMMNPGSFDYERWAFEQGVNATAYVIKNELNKKLGSVFGVNRIRGAVRDRVDMALSDQPYRGLVLALLLGDRSAITENQWQVLTATGTNHLVAISGLHIGLVAGAMFFLGRFVFRKTGNLLLYLPANKAAAILALAAALVYAMLAGFAVPTQRALVMIAVVMISVLLNRKFATSSILSAALFVVLLIDPFAVLSAGFWLSFAAVAAILYSMQSRWNSHGLWWKWGRIQWIVTIALIPILLMSFQQFSIISPVANVIAVPFVSVLVVPIVLLAGVLSFLPVISEYLFLFAHELLSLLWLMLDYMSQLWFAQWNQFIPVSWAIIPALFGVILYLSPRGMPGRYLATVFLLPLFFISPDKPKQGEAWFTLLDVGQGLAAVVQTENHLLLYDAGPKFSDEFDTGKAVVVPYLRGKAIEEIDVFVVSHGDNDHIGGLASILDAIPVKQIISGDMAKTSMTKSTQCLVGQSWEWDGVEFEIVHPAQAPHDEVDNNDSCVLRITVAEHSILITGDIEKSAEKLLLKRGVELESDILVVPHHGSNTSSTEKFIDAVKPIFALYPAAYSNRYGFPKAKVVARYDAKNIEQFSTGGSGAITFVLAENTELNPYLYRKENRRFWHR